MHMRTKIRLSVFSIAIMIVAIMAITQKGFAWTNPTANPPVSTSVITTSGGNLGVGVVTPLVKLHVNGSVRGDQAGALRIDSGNGTLDVGAMNASYAHFQTDRPNFYFNKSVSVDGALSNYANAYYLAQSGTSYLNGGAVGIGTTSPDANYKITTTGGGIKAENSSATQPAGYFSNAGGGPAITVGTGGITLGGVNRTSWATGADNLGNHTATAALNMSGNDITALRNLTLDGYITPGSVGTDSGITGAQHYRFGYQEGGAWVGPYPDLVVGYHTGLKLGANSSYGGTRFYNDHPSVSSTELMSIGNGDNHVRISNNLYVTGTITAGAGGITLGGVNKTSWPSGTDDTKVLKAGDTMTGNLRFGSVGLGSVGVYDPTKTQAVWSMGPAYVLPAGGGTTSYGTLYGLGWSYNPDYSAVGNNPQSKPGLNHQLLVMNNAVTQTAIGTGIWTNGNITSVGSAIINGGSSSNWASVNAPTFNAGTSIYSYGSICAGNASGTCGGSGGTVIGAVNTAAANNIPNSGNVIFNNGSNVGIGTASPDANYKLTTSGGGIKAENSSATQPAGYFSNAGGGPAVIIGTGGITLGGVNQTAWPSGGGQWATSGNNIYSTNSGNTGIGTASPSKKLDVNGQVRGTGFCIGNSCVTDWAVAATTTTSNGTRYWANSGVAYTGNFECIAGGYDSCLSVYDSSGALSTCSTPILSGYARCSKVNANRLSYWADAGVSYTGDFKCIAGGNDSCLSVYSASGALSTCSTAIRSGYARCSKDPSNDLEYWADAGVPYTGNFKCIAGGNDSCLSVYDASGALSTCSTPIRTGYARCQILQ